MPNEELEVLVETIVAKMGTRTCGEHSGLAAWIKVGCGLLTTLIGVFSIQTFWVAPDIRAEAARQVAANEKRFYAVERDVADLKQIDLRIINQRNLDHTAKEKLQ